MLHSEGKGEALPAMLVRQLVIFALSPSFVGSQVRNIYYSCRDESKGEADYCHIFNVTASL